MDDTWEWGITATEVICEDDNPPVDTGLVNQYGQCLYKKPRDKEPFGFVGKSHELRRPTS